MSFVDERPKVTFTTVYKMRKKKGESVPLVNNGKQIIGLLTFVYVMLGCLVLGENI
jgi:hypothetical protein